MSADEANGSAYPKLWKSLFVAGAFPVSVIIISLWLTTQFDTLLRQQAVVEQSYRQQAAVATLISNMKDAETSQRGFVISGNPAFLEPYVSARADIGGELQRLDAMFAQESPAVRQHLSRIAALVPEKFQEMQHVLDIRTMQGRDAAADVIAQGAGKKLMDQIRAEADAITKYQDAQLTRQVSDATRRVEHSRRFYLIAVALITIVSLLAAFRIWTGRRLRHKAAVEAIDAGSRQAAIFNSTLNAIILINPSGSIEIMNPAAERMFGFPATDVVRRDISIIADIAPGEGPFLDRIGLGENGLAEPHRPMLHAHCADGGKVPVEVALGLMPLEDGMHVVAVFSDVTDREKVEQIKDQFLSTVSHELRTPLTSIVGSLGLLKAGITDPISSQAQRLVDIAENNANRLIRIVNDILDAEKLQSGQMSFTMQPLDLCAVTTTAVNGMGGLAATKTIKLTLDCPPEIVTVRGDGERLVQVVNNLVSNAIKFSPANSRIDVSVFQDGNHACVAIADQGMGIPLDLRARLFTRFAQAPGTAMTGMPGTGLGLAISRDIVRYHGGAISFADGPDGGTVFSFDLPLWNALTAQEDLNGSPRLLLYADAAEAEALSADFARRSIRADVVADVTGAVKAVKLRRYLAMIVDFQFAGEHGRDAIQAVRAEPLARNLPIIGIASEAVPMLPDDTAAIDIIDWLQKPISTTLLDDAVAAAMRRASVEMPLVLHVDDDYDTLQITATALSGLANVQQASNLSQARAFMARQAVDILIIDIALPDGSGLDLVADMAGTERAGTPVIIYSAQDGGSDLRNVEAILTKSKRSLPNLVETILAIRDRQEGGRE